MTNESVRLTRRVTGDGQQVATLTITSKMGAMGPGFWQDAARALGDLEGVRVLTVRGEGLFSAGLDVKASAADLLPALGDEARFAAIVAGMHAVTEGVAALPIPVIVTAHGWCIGAGLELAAAADLRLCSADARFMLPEVRLGITADLGGLQRLPGLIGRGRAAHLALTGQPVDAATAERWGLVTEVLPDPEALFARADALADALAALPAHALEGTKRSLNAEGPHAARLAADVAWNARHMTAEGLQAALRRA
ncbi:enoyl-CoA hydratase-related protein [Deinococcus sp. Leaf326]|jgi:enoyl-CoA hydratase|uniref:enoyl-CoA hydratase-related protein n=1 Tax=Deinococcus sp. Leaf326 TaxID=1736338 RepID=UPI0006F5A68D|nr:enoyl-CoA hydratase-related protein [Deinococcus sp. Leaf326]KQR36215.1 enoyl-CoA hydratase [Deinococcus sp. Leaf326]